MSGVDCRYVTSTRGIRSQPAQMEVHPERRSLDSDGGSEMDADCCGDSGPLPLISLRPFWQTASKLPSLHVPGWQPAGILGAQVRKVGSPDMRLIQRH